VSEFRNTLKELGATVSRLAPRRRREAQRELRRHSAATFIYVDLLTRRRRTDVRRCKLGDGCRQKSMGLGPYFLNQRGDPRKVYCSKTCAKHKKTLGIMRAKRKREAEERINRVIAAERTYERLKRRPKSPHQWVARRTGLSKWWITRNRNELQRRKGLIE
jgi:hypothetical protein